MNYFESVKIRNISVSLAFAVISLFLASALPMLTLYIENEVIVLVLEAVYEVVLLFAAVVIGKLWLINDESMIADLLEIVLPSVAAVVFITGYFYFWKNDTSSYITHLPVLQEYMGIRWNWLKVFAAAVFALLDGFCLYGGMLWGKRCWERKREKEK